MVKVLRFLIFGEKCIGCNLFLGQFSWGAVFLGAICLKGNYVDNKSEKQFLLGAIIFGVIVRKQSSRANYLGGNIPWGQLSGLQFSLGAIILGSNCPGGN